MDRLTDARPTAPRPTAATAESASVSGERTIPPPYALLAELTHGCPLHCVYCSNPLALVDRGRELPTADWARVFGEAAELGVVQTHLSGGEPLLRDDLEELAAAASGAGLYVQLTTSGIGLDAPRAAGLRRAGVRVVQLSAQGADAETGDRIAGYRAHDRKERAARLVRDAGISLTLNVVLHRLNLDAVDRIVELALDWGAERLELANAQYYNWALRNRDTLLPSPDMLARAHETIRRLRPALGDTLDITWVDADYVSGRVKPCMGGWARRSMTIAPDGRALPCPVADGIATLTFDSVRDRPLAWIWQRSAAFRAYRGTSWMPEPCRSCDRREIDFGGCRCQAFALTGDAARTDPVCSLSPDHALVERAVEQTAGAETFGSGVLVHRGYARPPVSG